MNNGLTAENLLLALPEALRQDEQMQALAAGIAEVLAARPAEIDRLLIYPRIDELPEALLDRLAYDFKVDWWDAEYSLAAKRQTLKDNWQVHRRLGTKAAVEQAIAAIYPKTQVLEWFEYGGEPYHFKLEINLTGSSFDRERQQRVLDRVEYYKNLRSHLDGVFYFANVGPLLFHNPENFRLTSVQLPFYFFNQPNDVTLLNGRRTLDGSWRLDQAFRGVVMQTVELVLPWPEQLRAMAAGSLLAPEIKLHNHNHVFWPEVRFASRTPNQSAASSKSLRFGSCFASSQPAAQGGSLTRDTMWLLDGELSLNGSKKLNAAIVTEEL